MKKMYFALLILGLVMTSCGGGGDPTGQANDICGCINEAGIKLDGVKDPDDLDSKMDTRMDKLSEKEQKKLRKCIAGVLKDVKDDMGDMKDEQKSEYIREFLIAAIDSDCTEKVMEDMEYDELEDMLELYIDLLNGKDGSRNYGRDDATSDVSYGGDSYGDDSDEWSEAGNNNCGDYVIRWGGYKGRELLDCSGPGCDCR
jgi:hypothetical protein